MRRMLLFLLACLLATGTATPAVAGGRGAVLPGGASGADGVSRHPLGVGRWRSTGMTVHGRGGHTATALASGKVLVAGGTSDVFRDAYTPATGAAELYDPATGTWRRTGFMRAVREGHTATLLPSGQVLVTGGVQDNDEYSHPLATAELYDPATRRWTATGAMHQARLGHQATLLMNGKVLVEGGNGAPYVARTAELYDPTTGQWTKTGSMTTSRYNFTATALPGGKVLVAGGRDYPTDSGVPGWQSSAEIYDSATGRWTATQPMSVARDSAQATALPDGRVLVSGGGNGDVGVLASSEIYDPATQAWAPTGALHIGRSDQTSSLLANGTVLTSGGYGETYDTLSSAEVFDPATGQWKVTGSMTTPRIGHTLTRLATGKVLATGGDEVIISGKPVLRRSAELYTPAP